MRNTRTENIQEHSLQVAMIAHSLAIIKNKVFDGKLYPERAMGLSLYHEVAEIITGDFGQELNKIQLPEVQYFRGVLFQAFH